MNIVYGFGGLRSDGEMLSLAPNIPAQWYSYKFRIVYGDEVLSVEYTDSFTLSLKTTAEQLSAPALILATGAKNITLRNNCRFYALWPKRPVRFL